MREFTVTMKVRAESSEAVEDWLASYLSGDIDMGVEDFCWIVDDDVNEGDEVLK